MQKRKVHSHIHTWKILEGVVPNPTFRNHMISAHHHPRFGPTCCRKTVYGISLKHMSFHVNSFTYEGPRLFTCLPRGIRNLTKCSTHVLKRHLDKFLQGLPDEPPIKNAHTAEQKNNLQRRTPKLTLTIDF